MTPTFFLLDADTSQPVCFTIGSAARRATQAAPELLALAPMTSTRYQQARWRALPEASFQRHWAGYATTKQPYALGPEQWEGFEFVQRSGERSQAYQFKGYFCSADRSAMRPWPWSFPSAGISRSSSRSIKLWVGIRVHDDTIVVTYYNAPNVESLRAHYQDLPARLPADKINPCIPWLDNFKLDFRFK